MNILGFQLKYFVPSQMFSELFRNVMLWIEVVAVCSFQIFAIIFCNLILEVFKNSIEESLYALFAVAVLQKFETSLVTLILQVFSWILLER